MAGFAWLVPAGATTLAARRRSLAVAAWVLMHDSGVHATIAGVLLGVSVPVHGRDR